MASEQPWGAVLRRRLTRRRLLAAGLAVGAAAAAAACGGEEAQPPKPTSSISAYTCYSLPPERRPTVEAAGANAHTDSHRPFLTSVVDRVGRASDGTDCGAKGSAGWPALCGNAETNRLH